MNKELDEKELSAVFEEDDKKLNSFQGAVKKAQRQVFNRQIYISTLVSIGVIILLFAGWLSLMGLSQTNAIHDERIYNTIRNPNVYEAGYQMNGDSLFEGSVVFTQYKMLGNKPVNWNNEIIKYNLLGGSNRIWGDHSPIQVTDEDDSLPRFFNRDVKERLIQFYHPVGKYNSVRNDLNHLTRMGPNQTIEMALSFNKDYSPDEVRQFLPNQVSLKWYWVDTFKYKDNRLNTVMFNEDEVGSDPLFPDEVYGFSEVKGMDLLSEEYFLRDLKSGVKNVRKNDFAKEFTRIYGILRGEKKEPVANEIPVIGAVVTGSPKELESLKGNGQIRAAVFGAITDKDY